MHVLQTPALELAGGGLGDLDVLAAEDSLISTRRTAAVLQTRAFSLDVALVRVPLTTVEIQ